MKVIKEIFNISAHVGAGMWTGKVINDPEYRHGGWAILITFLVYQVWNSHRKGDKGYPEIKQFGIGMAILLAALRFMKWLYSKK